MTKIKRDWDLLSEKQRQSAIKDIIDFFSNERNEEIGVIAAENILDMLLQSISFNIYNKGIEDSKNFIKSRFEETELDIETNLKKI